MLSFGPFQFATYLYSLENDPWRPRRLYNALKTNLYRCLLFHSVIRMSTAIYFLISGRSLDFYRKLDPYFYYSTIVVFDGIINMPLGMLCFVIYRWILLESFRDYILKYMMESTFWDFKAYGEALKVEGAKYRLWGRNRKFKQVLGLVTARLVPFSTLRDRLALVKLIFRFDAVVYYFNLLHYVQTWVFVYVFFTEFVRPMALGLFWSIWYCVEVFITLLYTYDIIRESLIVASYAVYIIAKFISQMKSVTGALHAQLSRKSINTRGLRRAVYKCHLVHVLVLLGNIDLNKRIVQRFYAIAVCANLFSNVSIIAGFATTGYKEFLETPLKVAVVIQIVTITMVGLYFINSSTALIKPAKAIYSSTIVFRKSNFLELAIHVRLMAFYEMLHHKRNFKFDFGPMGKISKKSLLAFWGFYFGAILMVIDDFSENHQKYQKWGQK